MNLIKYATNWKYRYFYKKVHDVEKSIAEYEFKVAKSRQIREGVRTDRDRAMQAIANIEDMLKTAPEDKKEQLNKDLAANKDNVARYEAQMKMIDDQINGGAVTDANPAGIGILEQIKSLTELKLMYSDYCSRL